MTQKQSTPVPSTLSHEDRAGAPDTVRVVLPAYNEAASIAELIDRIGTVLGGQDHAYEILVIDDGSADGTAGIARALSNRYPVTVVSNDRNRGLGHTIGRGLTLAAESSGHRDVIVTMDADLTQDPTYIPRMIDAYRSGADVVIASRFRPGSRVVGVPLLRRVLTWGARVVVSTLMPVTGVRDYSCGFRLYAAPALCTAIEECEGCFVTQTGFACMVEILGVLRGSAVFAEVPFELHYEEKRSPSAMQIRTTIRSYFSVFSRVRRLESRQRRSM